MDIYEIIRLILSFATLIFLAIYVWKTWSIAKSSKESTKQTRLLIEETRISRDEETAPHVIVFFDVHDGIIDLVMRNSGKSIAKNIKIDIEPDISNLLIDKKSRAINNLTYMIYVIPIYMTLQHDNLFQPFPVPEFFLK